MLIWYSAPEPRSGRSRRVRPAASVTTAPASCRHSAAAARSYGELLRTWPPPTRSNAARADGISAISRGPGSTYASSWPVSTHMRSKHAEPSSNVAAADRRAVDEVAEHLDGHARGPPAEPVGPEHPIERRVRAERDGRGAPHAAAAHRVVLAPRLDLDDAAATTAPIVGSPSASGAAATETQADSRPGHRRARPVDGVDHEHVLGAPRRGDQAAVLAVEGELRRVLGDEALELLGPRVDRERHVAAGALARVHAAGVRAQLGQHPLAQAARDRRALLGGGSRRSVAVARGASRATARSSPSRSTSSVTTSAGAKSRSLG